MERSNVSLSGLRPERVRELLAESLEAPESLISVDPRLFSASNLDLMKVEAKALEIDLGEYLGRMVNAGLEHRKRISAKTRVKKLSGRSLVKAGPYYLALSRG